MGNAVTSPEQIPQSWLDTEAALKKIEQNKILPADRMNAILTNSKKVSQETGQPLPPGVQPLPKAK